MRPAFVSHLMPHIFESHAFKASTVILPSHPPLSSHLKVASVGCLGAAERASPRGLRRSGSAGEGQMRRARASALGEGFKGRRCLHRCTGFSRLLALNLTLSLTIYLRS